MHRDQTYYNINQHWPQSHVSACACELVVMQRALCRCALCATFDCGCRRVDGIETRRLRLDIGYVDDAMREKKDHNGFHDSRIRHTTIWIRVRDRPHVLGHLYTQWARWPSQYITTSFHHHNQSFIVCQRQLLLNNSAITPSKVTQPDTRIRIETSNGATTTATQKPPDDLWPVQTNLFDYHNCELLNCCCYGFGLVAWCGMWISILMQQIQKSGKNKHFIERNTLEVFFCSDYRMIAKHSRTMFLASLVLQ